MFRFILLYITISLLATGIHAQTDEILLTIGEEQVSKAEFEYIYKKNNSNLYNESDKKSPKDYLDLYINFKLKVLEAERLKMDTNKVFIDELAGYRKEVAAPYLTDMNYNDELVAEMYRRMKQEVNASHILLRLDKNASPQQESEVLNRINSIRQEILNGKDFGQAAIEYSQDPSAQTNKGNLNYFSAFTMVYPFENAAYTTPVNEVSEPFRTAFGYHLIKVHDVRENQGELLVAHIMKRFPQDASAETKAKLKTSIDAIYQQLLDGADFAELAKNMSDDKPTSVKGGEMPWFAAGRIIPEFANPAFAIKNIGDITEPVETRFGYHIIKKIDYRPIPPIKEAKADIEAKIKRDPERNNGSKKSFIEKLKAEYDFSENQENKKLLSQYIIGSESDIPEKELFTIDGKTYGTKELKLFVSDNKINSGTYLNIYNQWIDEEIIKLEDKKLEKKYPEFRFLMNEYHDGILLFNISQEKIWNYASTDSLGLIEFYKKNKNNHFWGERFKGYIINCTSEEIREEADKLFGENLTPDEVSEHLNTESEVITIEEGAWEQGSNPIVDYYVWNGPEPENFNSAITFIRGDKIPSEAKKLDEARGLFISDYQNYLEKKWIRELHSRYKVKVNKKLLKTVQGV